ncbi:hypothetical protein RBU49_02905 [Clostridium sp. MB40-C1]|uniref:hypothetical protein n=1 Tax=Clostridium sp. MB40-C1 TaxID=3070996 RepID=UPI0027DF94DC|nr:hypothetical protein [Clostridium sp. MB40-C1]WMJ81219.1 hypothetical protein RBU49_02905 [Clostridium sp. MB40-C1]
MEENKINIKDILYQLEKNPIETQLKELTLRTYQLQKQVQIQFQNQIKDSLNSFSENIAMIPKYVIKNLLINIDKINVDFEKLSERQKQLAIKMIKNGWYFSFELPLDSYKLLKLNNRQFNSVLVEFYERYEENMINRIIEQYPHRKKILFKAYKAHKKKEYELSIPVMLAQSDGISLELFNKKLFSKDNKGKLVTEGQEEIFFEENDPVDICFYIQLATIGQLNENYNPPTYKNCKKFNRHTVLHGKDINYAKKINSIKCLVMLNFLAEIKECYYEDKN